jgi:hypothetical protein
MQDIAAPRLAAPDMDMTQGCMDSKHAHVASTPAPASRHAGVASSSSFCLTSCACRMRNCDNECWLAREEARGVLSTCGLERELGRVVHAEGLGEGATLHDWVSCVGGLGPRVQACRVRPGRARRGHLVGLQDAGGVGQGTRAVGQA